MMTKDELELKIKEICPEMMTHSNFMHAAECVFCKEVPNDSGKALTGEEFEAWDKLSDKLHTATVKQVIEYLQKNFKPEDKLCYMDYVQGCKNDCAYVTKDQLGQGFFYYVKDLKRRVAENRGSVGESEHDAYPYVSDDDVVII